MIYTTGTIAISGNTLTGTGTNFTAAGSLIRNGCTVIALTSPARIPDYRYRRGNKSHRDTCGKSCNTGRNEVFDFAERQPERGWLAQDIAETFTMYQRYMSGFADVMNGTSDVTITINGVAVTVPVKISGQERCQQ